MPLSTWRYPQVLNIALSGEGHRDPAAACYQALVPWAFEYGVELKLKPIQNVFIESFNGLFRDEHWFSDVVHAREIVNICRQDYNEWHPHSSLNYQTPSEFTVGWRNGESERKPTDITNLELYLIMGRAGQLHSIWIFLLTRYRENGPLGMVNWHRGKQNNNQ